jgi:hypothetical protein
MFVLLMVPIVVVVAAVHRVLQMYAPSNVLAARVRRERPRLGTAIRLGAMAAGLVGGAHLLDTWASTGGPGWLNLVVLVAIWDAFKFAILAIVTIFRRARVALYGATRHRRSLVAP